MFEGNTKEARRLLSFLGAGGASVRRATVPGNVLLESAGAGAISVAADRLTELARRGVIARNSSAISLTDDGRALLRRLASEDPYQDQHRHLESAPILLPEGPGQVIVNGNESPLAQLARRRDKSGRPF